MGIKVKYSDSITLVGRITVVAYPNDVDLAHEVTKHPKDRVKGRVMARTKNLVTTAGKGVMAGLFGIYSNYVGAQYLGIGDYGVAPPSAPLVGSQTNAGSTLPAGTYYVKITRVCAAGETKPSPESSIVIGATTQLNVQVESFQPWVTSENVYISTTSGTETKQGSEAVSSGTFVQSSALVAGAAPPSSNPAAPVNVADTQLGHEIFRKQITGSFLTGNQIDCSTYILAGEANFEWTEIALFGNGATSTQGSGTGLTHATIALAGALKTNAQQYTVDYNVTVN